MSASSEIQPRSETTAPSPENHRLLRSFCGVVALALGGAQAWTTRFTMNPDGVSYLDVGDAYWRGDWHNAINAYWSPLYSWILGCFLRVLKPPAYWEYPLVHLVNFLIYVAALGCFEFFLATFIAKQKGRKGDLSAQGEIGIPEWAWWVLGYSLFVSSFLNLIGMRFVTPDMCVGAFVYLASALMLKIRGGLATRRTFVALGVVLGFAYLAKAVMFPLGLVLLGVAVFAGGLSRSSMRNTAVATLIFLAITSPFIGAISYARRRPTFGDSGRLTYAGCINGIDPWYPGDGGRLTCLGIGYVEGIDEPSPVSRYLRHPAIRISDLPAAYSFTEHAVGTYPFWYDISYWQDGIKGHFDARAQSQASSLSLLVYVYLLLTLHLNLLVVFVTLLLISQRGIQFFSRRSPWELIFPAVLTLIMYALVHAEYRYIAGFACVLWLAAFSMLHFENSPVLHRFIGVGVLAVAATTLWLAGIPVVHGVSATKGKTPAYAEAGIALTGMGMRPAERIGVISSEPFGEGGAFVARLAALQIIAQVNQPDRFWSSPASTQSAVLETFRRTGCQAVLAWRVPASASGWQRLGETEYYFLNLDTLTSPISSTTKSGLNSLNVLESRIPLSTATVVKPSAFPARMSTSVSPMIQEGRLKSPLDKIRSRFTSQPLTLKDARERTCEKNGSNCSAESCSSNPWRLRRNVTRTSWKESLNLSSCCFAVGITRSSGKYSGDSIFASQSLEYAASSIPLFASISESGRRSLLIRQ